MHRCVSVSVDVENLKDRCRAALRHRRFGATSFFLVVIFCNFLFWYNYNRKVAIIEGIPVYLHPDSFTFFPYIRFHVNIIHT